MPCNCLCIAMFMLNSCWWLSIILFVYVSLHFTSIYALCFCNAFFLISWRIKALWQNHNACDLVFPPLIICLRKVEGGNQKKGKWNKVESYISPPWDPSAEGKKEEKQWKVQGKVKFLTFERLRKALMWKAKNQKIWNSWRLSSYSRVKSGRRKPGVRKEE